MYSAFFTTLCLYGTEKTTSKLQNRITISWFLIIAGIILLFFKDFASIRNFQSIGKILDSLIILILGISILVEAKRKIGKIKDIQFGVNPQGFTLKSHDVTRHFSLSNPAASIKLSFKKISIVSTENEIIEIDLDNYSLNYEDSKKIRADI